MCLILFANRTHPEYPLVIAANRDEAYARPTAPAAFWEDDPRICGGRDLEQGGTWLGVTRTGAFAAVTNFRSSIGAKNNTRSRGELVANYLRGRAGPADYVAQVHPAPVRTTDSTCWPAIWRICISYRTAAMGARSSSRVCMG